MIAVTAGIDSANAATNVLRVGLLDGGLGGFTLAEEPLPEPMLNDGDAIKIPLAELPHSKANVRSALNRATRKLGMSVATAVDDGYLYVWNS